MEQRPIAFNGNMILAILGGRKTQTRRMVQARAGGKIVGPAGPCLAFELCSDVDVDRATSISCPYGQPGDRLWVQEEWGVAVLSFDPPYVQVSYSASGSEVTVHGWHRATEYISPDLAFQWCEAKRMPRWASRIALRNESVRVEQLMDITEEAARAEGFCSREAFLKAFRAIYGLAEDANPCVWAIGFKVLEAVV